MEQEKKKQSIVRLLLLILFMTAVMVAMQNEAVTAEVTSPDGAPPWGDEMHISTTSPDGAFVPTISHASDGRVMVAYRHNTPGGFNLPYFVQTQDSGNSWETPGAIRTGSTPIPQVELTFSNNSTAYAVWRTETDILFSSENNWSGPGTPIVATAALVYDPDIAVAPNGTIHVVWAQKDPGAGVLDNIHHAYSQSGGAGWTVSPALATNTQRSSVPAIAVDSAGNVHVVWEERIFNMDILAFVNTIYYKKGTWSGNNLVFSANPTPISDDEVDSERPAIVATSDGRVHISYTEDLGDDSQYPMYAQYNGASWLAPVDITDGVPVGVNQADPFYLITTIDACDGIVYIYYHGSQSPTSKEQILGRNSGDSWATLDEVTESTFRSINPDVVCYGSEVYMAFSRIEESGPNAGTNQIYGISASGGGIFLPILMKN